MLSVEKAVSMAFIKFATLDLICLDHKISGVMKEIKQILMLDQNLNEGEDGVERVRRSLEGWAELVGKLSEDERSLAPCGKHGLNQIAHAEHTAKCDGSIQSSIKFLIILKDITKLFCKVCLRSV